MERVRILQIGDIHFSAERLAEAEIDLRDRQFPASVASIVTSNPIENSIRLMVEVIRKKPVDAVAIVGDLTDQGNIDNYKKCVNYLKNSLDLQSIAAIENIHCVPGNHDVSIKGLDPIGRDSDDKIWEKFDPLNDEWLAIATPVLATKSIRKSTITKGQAALSVVSLNSCVGCGEYRDFPDPIKTAITDFLQSQGDADQWKTYEQLDTPCFAANHIQEVSICLGDGAKKISIIVSHHNLLPQSTPRISPYAELLNGGQLRTMLGRSQSPVVYCHGHIHTDPVEVIGCAENLPPRLITISAPLLKEGFNILEIFFCEYGNPLGIEVQKYRISESMPFSLEPVKKLRIPFRRPEDYRELMDEKRALLSQLIESKEINASRMHREIVGKGHQVSAEEFQNILQEMEWHGIVSIANLGNDFRYWKIQRLAA